MKVYLVRSDLYFRTEKEARECMRISSFGPELVGHSLSYFGEVELPEPSAETLAALERASS